MRKIVKLVATLYLFIIITFIGLLFIVITSVATIFSNSSEEKIITNYEAASIVKNNRIYAAPYKRVLNKYLYNYGYVSLERMIFYLQRTNNILDVSLLDDNEWNKAYLINLNLDEKQMIPIGKMCESINSNDSLSKFNVKSDGTHDVIDLCTDNLENNYKQMPYVFPLQTKFVVTSYTHEQRIVFGKSDVHNGWDLAVPIGTNFYSICNGEVSQLVNTQPNDLPYNKSKNKVGNYIKVKCDNGLTAIYYHIKYKSSPKNIKVKSKVVAGELLGQTSTTGESTGPHLHVGLVDINNQVLDFMEYTDMKKIK